MSEKKVVSRNVAIALGIIIIIVLVGLVGAIANYTSIINGKDNTITTKDSQIQVLTNQKNQLQTWLDGNKTQLQGQIEQLQKWLEGNMTISNQALKLQEWLEGNITLLNEMQTWLSGNVTLLNQMQTWLEGNITYYKSQIDSKNSEIANLQNQISNLNSQINSLKAQIANLQNQIVDLQNQINSLKAPKLIKVDLRAEDNRPWLQTPYLHVYGYVCNVGTNTAYNSKIHVIAYQSGGVVAINTDIILGTIYGESWKSVDANLYYQGNALTGWTLTLEWTS
jgi:TolA-binding protein